MPATPSRLLLAALILTSGAACAADPTRPLRIVVAATPGSPADERVRSLVPALEARLGRSILVDNRGLDDGIRAAQSVAGSAADGNTLLFGNSGTHAANPALHPRLPYDPVRDFVAVSQIAASGLVIVGNPDWPGQNVEALVRHAKTLDRAIAIGGETIVERVAGAAFGRHLKLPTRTVQHASSIEHMQALRSGKTDLALLVPHVARPHVHAGRLRAFGITGEDRSPALPEVATLAEQGNEGFDVPSWEGVFAPAGTPAQGVDAAYRALRQALAIDEVRDRFRDLGVTPVGSAPDAFAAVVRRDIEVFRRLAAQARTAAQ
jgi:tripartite-type tricarboxylate transporter receptor subunit TctC